MQAWQYRARRPSVYLFGSFPHLGQGKRRVFLLTRPRLVLLAAQDWSQNVLRRFSYGSCFRQVRQIFGRTAYLSRAARLDARLFWWIFDAAFVYPSFSASLASTCRLPTEQVEGLEPPSTDYETVVLPLNHTCVFCVSNYHLPCSAYLSYPTISREGGTRTRNLRLPMPARSQLRHLPSRGETISPSGRRGTRTP
jgi:hypothetical protein